MAGKFSVSCLWIMTCTERASHPAMHITVAGQNFRILCFLCRFVSCGLVNAQSGPVCRL